jgi:hypothetical protein
MESIFKIKLSEKIGAEYLPMMNDIARFVCIQVIVQLMLFTINGQVFSFFSLDFFLLISFIVMGVLFYWLVFKKLVSFS